MSKLAAPRALTAWSPSVRQLWSSLLSVPLLSCAPQSPELFPPGTAAGAGLPSCRGEAVAVAVQPETPVVRCEGDFACKAEITLTVRSCVEHPVTVTALRFGCPPDSESSCGEYHRQYRVNRLRLAAGWSWTWTGELDIRGPAHKLSVLLSRRLGKDPAPGTVDVQLSTPRTRRDEACRRCDGVIKRGLLGEYCNCRTSDGGAECHQGRDCEGYCDPSGSEVVREDGSYVWLIPVGQCSERKTHNGCHSRLPREAEPPVRQHRIENRILTLPSVCSD